VIANARVFGGGFRIAPAADLSDGQLDAVAFANMPRRRRFPIMLSLLRGTHGTAPEVRLQRAASFRLRFAGPPAYETDGEWNRASSSELTIGTRPAALRVLVPPRPEPCGWPPRSAACSGRRPRGVADRRGHLGAARGVAGHAAPAAHGDGHHRLVHEGMSNGIFGIIRAAGGTPGGRARWTPRSRLRGDEPPVAARHPDRGPDGAALHPALHRARPLRELGAFGVAVHAPARMPDHRAREPQGLPARAAGGGARQPPRHPRLPGGPPHADGEIQEFHTAGLEIMLRERPLPVYVLVTDGFWKGRRFVDFLFNIDRIDGRTEVLGRSRRPRTASTGRSWRASAAR
jgi:hypothetical protein